MIVTTEPPRRFHNPPPPYPTHLARPPPSLVPMADSNRANPARIIVLLLLLLALAAGVYARYGISGRGVLTIRNDSREPIHIAYAHPANAAVAVDTRLDPGATVSTTFRSGAILEAWLGEIRPDQVAAWRIDKAGPWILIHLDQFEFRLEGDALQAESLTTSFTPAP